MFARLPYTLLVYITSPPRGDRRNMCADALEVVRGFSRNSNRCAHHTRRRNESISTFAEVALIYIGSPREKKASITVAYRLNYIKISIFYFFGLKVHVN